MSEFEASETVGEGDEGPEEVNLTIEEELCNFIENYRAADLAHLRLATSTLVQEQRSLLKSPQVPDFTTLARLPEYTQKVTQLKQRIARIDHLRRETLTRLRSAMLLISAKEQKVD